MLKVRQCVPQHGFLDAVSNGFKSVGNCIKKPMLDNCFAVCITEKGLHSSLWKDITILLFL